MLPLWTHYHWLRRLTLLHFILALLLKWRFKVEGAAKPVRFTEGDRVLYKGVPAEIMAVEQTRKTYVIFFPEDPERLEEHVPWENCQAHLFLLTPAPKETMENAKLQRKLSLAAKYPSQESTAHRARSINWDMRTAKNMKDIPTPDFMKGDQVLYKGVPAEISYVERGGQSYGISFPQDPERFVDIPWQHASRHLILIKAKKLTTLRRPNSPATTHSPIPSPVPTRSPNPYSSSKAYSKPPSSNQSWREEYRGNWEKRGSAEKHEHVSSRARCKRACRSKATPFLNGGEERCEAKRGGRKDTSSQKATAIKMRERRRKRRILTGGGLLGGALTGLVDQKDRERTDEEDKANAVKNGVTREQSKNSASGARVPLTACVQDSSKEMKAGKRKKNVKNRKNYGDIDKESSMESQGSINRLPRLRCISRSALTISILGGWVTPGRVTGGEVKSTISSDSNATFGLSSDFSADPELDSKTDHICDVTGDIKGTKELAELKNLISKIQNTSDGLNAFVVNQRIPDIPRKDLLREWNIGKNSIILILDRSMGEGSCLHFNVGENAGRIPVEFWEKLSETYGNIEYNKHCSPFLVLRGALTAIASALEENNFRQVTVPQFQSKPKIGGIRKPSGLRAETAGKLKARGARHIGHREVVVEKFAKDDSREADAIGFRFNFKSPSPSSEPETKQLRL